MLYNKTFFDKKSTEWIEAELAKHEARMNKYFKQMQKNGAHHVAINFVNTKATVMSYRAALADRKNTQ